MNAVKDYSRMKLTQLMTEHVVDESFPNRIKEKFSAKRQGVSGSTAFSLLQAAHSTYLFTLEDIFPGDSGMIGDIALLKDLSCVVVAGRTLQLNWCPAFGEPQPPLKIYVWGLDVKHVL